jgi:hypothetical protein
MLVDAETRAKVVVNNNTCNSIDTASYLYWVRVSALALGRATAAPPQWAFGQGQREAALQKYFQVGCKQFGDLVRHLVLTGGELFCAAFASPRRELAYTTRPQTN